MIAELDRYHGVVLRQLLVAHGGRAHIGVANIAGRVDSFCIERAAFQIKHSSRRLSPWQFTYFAENIDELTELRRLYEPVWIFLVCGQDGVVGLSAQELSEIVQIGTSGAGSIRVSRSRNAMYRVVGTLGELPRAKPRGVGAFVAEIGGSAGGAQHHE